MASVWRVYRSLEDVPADLGPCAVTIGNFDGVHRGHQYLFQQVVNTARNNGWRAVVLTFDPHPTKVVAPAKAPRLLTTAEQKLALMQELGLDAALVLPFNDALAKQSPEQFIQEILVGRLHAKAVLVGDNFRFGYQQRGDTALLTRIGKEQDFTCQVVPAITYRGTCVSSSVVRQLVTDGRATRVARLLRRPYALEGEVVPGHGVGRQQTVPTLNLETAAEVLPHNGVYITRTQDLDDGRAWPSITNVGMRPTFSGDTRTIETFLLRPLCGPTPGRIRVALLRWVRPERRFDNPAALKEQILRDVGGAEAYFRRLAKFAPNARC